MIDKILEEQKENDNRANQLRIFLLTLISSYKDARENMKVPVDSENLSNLIKKIKINFESRARTKTTGTFNVKHSEINVIKENFEDNSAKRNIFLLNHELTHLSSPLNKELYDDDGKISKSMQAEYDKMLEGKNNKDMSSFDVYMGAVAVDEVLAQWCCENCNDFMKNVNTKRKKSLQSFTIMGEPLFASTDFSDKDIYSPLQQYVEHFSSRLGFKTFKSFAKSILTGEKRLNDLVTPDTVEQLGYIGILCEGIYQDNKFNNYGLPKTDIPIALNYLDDLKKASSLPTGPDSEQK